MRSVAWLGASGGGRFMEVETGINNDLMKMWKFPESDREWFDEKVQG